ncbi:hypothetical protein, partial [Anaerospora sp.]|uniref:hypothetical protein n=1 Tax=Anaerospora sp. TaxID=1960278 RepID=UPI00289DB680
RLTTNQKVAGSNPAGVTISTKQLYDIIVKLFCRLYSELTVRWLIVIVYILSEVVLHDQPRKSKHQSDG